jgi:hypothetical protein
MRKKFHHGQGKTVQASKEGVELSSYRKIKRDLRDSRSEKSFGWLLEAL